MRTMKYLLTALILVSGQNLSQTKSDQIDALMQKYFENGQFNGSVLVAQNGKAIFEKGYGYANFEWKIPNTPDTKFRLGSVTKQFTAMLIMQQVQKGTISLDAPVIRYLPLYPRPQGEKVTIRHLLMHTSGIANYTDGITEQETREKLSTDQLVSKFADKPLAFEPGSKFSYCNSGYVLLGAILEAVTGKPYEDLIQENIFRPLGMKNSGYDHQETILEKRASGYEMAASRINAPFVDMSNPYAAGALYSTVEDLYIWDRALYSDTLLSEPNRKVYFTPGLSNYAFGWVVGKERIGNSTDSVLMTYHTGRIYGFGVMIARMTDRQDLIVLLNNTGSNPLFGCAQTIEAILNDKPYDIPRKSVALTLGEMISSGPIEKIRPEFLRLKGLTKEYELDDGEMYMLGRRLISADNFPAAIEVCILSAESFPGSWRVYDSLGEAYVKNGQKDLAIRTYEKSIELNPDNANAVQELKKLKEAHR